MGCHTWFYKKLNPQPSSDELKKLKVNDLIVKRNGLFYICDNTLPHDLFRIGNYPDDELMSMDETMDFIEKNKDKIYFIF